MLTVVQIESTASGSFIMAGMSGISGGMMSSGAMGMTPSASSGLSTSTVHATANANANTSPSAAGQPANTPATQLDQAFDKADQMLSSMQDSLQQNPMLRLILAMLMLEGTKPGSNDDDKNKSSLGSDALMALLAKDAQAISHGQQAATASTMNTAPSTSQVASTYAGGAAGAGGMMGMGMTA